MSLENWQDRIIYFVLIDRFYNGDKSIDDFGRGEFDPENDDCFQGGDLRGVITKLAHIKSLGFDAIWITPPVHNQWINPYIKTRGYHGYWAYDFTAVDPHFGDMATYKELVLAAHDLGMKVIQDIVVNHTGNYFTVEAKDYDPASPEKNWRALDDSFPPAAPPKAPNDPVFRMNNPNIPEHKAAGIYNFTPNISDFNSREQTLTWSMGDLDDLDLKNPSVVKRFKEIYRFWLEQAGIDGYRVDTVYYTPEEFYEKFLYDDAAEAPGIKRCAAQRGRRDFFVFGEVWSYDYKGINRYLREGKTRRLDSAIDLPLNEALTQVFYRKLPTQRLRKALQAKRHNRRLWVNFLDNHDVERMNSRAAWPGVQQSLAALFTLPGIPCVNYGTEAGFTRARQNMFDDKFFDPNSRYAVFLKQMTALRRAHPVFSRGACRVERDCAGCGILSYVRSYHDEEYRVVFNTAPDAMFYELGSPGGDFEVVLSSEGRVSVPDAWALAPESFLVLRRIRQAAAKAGVPPQPGVGLKPLAAGPARGALRLDFTLAEPAAAAELCVLVDDNYDQRILCAARAGAGSVALDTTRLGNGRHKLALLARTRDGRQHLSAPEWVNVRNPFQLLARAAVRESGQGGIGCRLHPPADPSYGRQLSIKSAAVYSSGRDLRLRIRMAAVTDDWNPPHGYDHVYFNVFFDFPGQKGRNFFPKLDYVRDDFEFNAGFLLYGWGVRSFGSADSAPDVYGAPLLADVGDKVDRRKGIIEFTFSGKFLDGLKTFSGVRIFISTWDGYLGEFRSIADRKEDWNFYTVETAPPRGCPKIFDHLLIEL